MLTTKPVTKSQVIEQNWKTYEQHVSFFDTNAVGIEFKKLYPLYCQFFSRGDDPDLDSISNLLNGPTLTPKFDVCKRLSLNIYGMYLCLYNKESHCENFSVLVSEILELKMALRAYQDNAKPLTRNFAMARGKRPN
jgi:hypothetical protein